MGVGDGGIRRGGAKYLQVEAGLVLRANAHLGRLRRLLAAVEVMDSDHGDSHVLQWLELAEGHPASSTSCLPRALLHPRPLQLGLMLLPARAPQACHMLLHAYILKSEGDLKLKIEKMAINLMISCTKSQDLSLFNLPSLNFLTCQGVKLVVYFLWWRE